MRNSYVVLIVAVVCGLSAAWFFTHYEKVVNEQSAGYQGEARFNDFLAAEMLLNALGIEADSRSLVSTNDWLPDDLDTLLIRVTPSIAVQDQRSTLDAWIHNGGHMVLLPPDQPAPLTDDFIDYFGFRLVEIEAKPADEPKTDDDAEDASYSYRVDLLSTHYRIELSDSAADEVTLSDELGNIAVRQPWGEGLVSLVANTHYFDNNAIAVADHARLLLDSVAGPVNSGKVWFIYHSTFPGLWSVIWKNARYVVIGLTLILLAWLWSVMATFGPKIVAAGAVRRSIAEHVVAAGRFMWRHDGASTLSAAAANALIHEAESRHPGIQRLSADKQAKLIAKMTGRSPQSVLDVLVAHDDRRQREFTHNMQLLQDIRREL